MNATVTPESARVPRRSHLDFTGTKPLLKVTLAQDLRNIAPWILLVTVLSVTSVLAFSWILDDPADRANFTATLGSNPALSLVFGPARDLTTADGFNAWRAGQLGALFAGLMGIFTVIRNSRADEDSGQAELIASGVLARCSRLAVAILMATFAASVLGVVSFIATVLCGGGVASTLVLSATFAASAMMFAGLAAVLAQVGSDARTASGISIAILGILYVLRGYFGSIGSAGWTAWITPFGWLEKVHPGSDNNPWPLLLAITFAGLLIAVAFLLENRRDFGQGLIRTRPGPDRARSARNAWGLAFKLHRGSVFAWLIGFVGLGLLFGNLASSVGENAGGSEMAKMFASGAITSSGFTFTFISTILQLVAIIAAILGIQVALRIHAEEIELRLEPLLAGSLRRSTYLSSNALIALAAPALAMLAASIALALVATAQDDSLAFGDIVAQGAITIVAVWVLVAIALATVGAAPRLRIIAWIGVVATFSLTILGPTFNLPDWALGISPLHHIPDVTGSSPEWAALGWLGLVVVLLLAVAFAGFRRRDVL